ncbi:MAG: hypothetical protein ACRD8Z_17970 [Nitrososphaeraceae archaeon]
MENILKPTENYKGLSYGNLIATWTNWLFSSEVDYSEATDILFLRGSVGTYETTTTSKITSNGTGTSTGNKIQSTIDTKFLNQTDENSLVIFRGTAIFVPVICAFYKLGDYFEGCRIEDEVGLRNAVFRTVGAGNNMWAKCRYQNDPIEDGYHIPSAPDLSAHYMESPLFKLFVSERSKLKDKLDEPLEAGVYDAVTGGYFLLLKNLGGGDYRLRFGGKGKGNYLTDSIYDITISNTESQSIREAGLKVKSDIPKRDGFRI